MLNLLFWVCYYTPVPVTIIMVAIENREIEYNQSLIGKVRPTLVM